MNDAKDFAKAFVEMYKDLDAPGDEMTDREFRIAEKWWPQYLYACGFIADKENE